MHLGFTKGASASKETKRETKLACLDTITRVDAPVFWQGLEFNHHLSQRTQVACGRVGGRLRCSECSEPRFERESTQPSTKQQGVIGEAQEHINRCSQQRLAGSIQPNAMEICKQTKSVTCVAWLQSILLDGSLCGSSKAR